MVGWFHWSYLSIILDVFLVSFLIYRTLLLVKGTRALPMLAGLGIIVVVYFVSRELSLVTLHWLLDTFLSSVILVVVVLFQDDLRRALIKVGLGPGRGNFGGAETEQTITEISRAAADLSSRRFGAIIVLKRTIGLEEYTEHAIMLNAAVNHQLLVSIFLRTSPLHDGAVIIEGARLTVAGAVLPLTFNPSVSNQLGTRHRAAIGLSERTDAVVVVVSEETGAISLVREGRITRDLDEKSLYNALHRLIVPRRARPSWITQRKLFWRNLRRMRDSDQIENAPSDEESGLEKDVSEGKVTP